MLIWSFTFIYANVFKTVSHGTNAFHMIKINVSIQKIYAEDEIKGDYRRLQDYGTISLCQKYSCSFKYKPTFWIFRWTSKFEELIIEIRKMEWSEPASKIAFFPEDKFSKVESRSKTVPEALCIATKIMMKKN